MCVHLDGKSEKEQGPKVDGDGSKLGKFFFYNHNQQVDGDDSKMGRFPLYNQGAQVDEDGSKLGKFFFYNHDEQVDRDDSKMTHVHGHNGAHKISQKEGKLHICIFFYASNTRYKNIFSYDHNVKGDKKHVAKLCLQKHMDHVFLL